MKKKLGITLLTLTLTALLSGCGDSADNKQSTATPEQTLNITSEAQISTMDPALAADTTSTLAMNQVYEGLYIIGKDDEFVLGAAAEEPEVSDDQLTYTFSLREDAKWSNGEPVTAHDFVYAWRLIADPTTGSPNTDVLLGVIKNAKAIYTEGADPETLGVKALDDYTLEVTLEQPIPYLKSLLTFAIFYPKNQAFIESQGQDYGTSGEHLIYNGPFVLKKWDSFADEWTYEKNPEYWDHDKVQLAEAKVSVIKSPSTAVNLFTTGEVNVVNKLTSEFAKNYREDDSFLPVKQYVTFFLKMNPKRGDKETPLANLDLRKAIAQAFDKQKFVENILGDGSTPTNHLIPKGQTPSPDGKSDFTDAASDAYDYFDYNPEEAQKSWEKAQETLGKTVSVEFLTDDTDAAKTSAEFFADQLETNLPGLTVKIVQVPFPIRVERDQKQDFEIQLSGWGTDYRDPLTVMRIFTSNNPTGGITYANPDYDALIDASRTTDAKNNSKRIENFIEAENILLNQDVMLAPIYNRSLAILSNPDIQDMYWHPFGPSYSLKWAFRQ
ncbi:peptide ABC transporter substrate-binding protein [Vagococcus sp. BWB3-3]|uniref:Peptide ABC transporter substrate-binding protein n=1 Tax=Vagococcus allomyrinae TaxID=2794353 RepID=A0A940SU87_9ENTE|nr:peptide ABC transporter substrate-binding protein [Vagococcus allomyrinae]MBP1040499.1 peptide ABC transporter substrate-binding protein [Vagococcus allomyrinae]